MTLVKCTRCLVRYFPSAALGKGTDLFGKISMKRWNFTLPELEQRLSALAEGAMCQITRRDYERLFGTNSAARGRLRHFAKSHECVVSHADHAILFRRQFHSQSKADPHARPERMEGDETSN